MKRLEKIMSPSRHLLSLSAGVLGGALPNEKSNIHPYLMGALIAIALTKILLGDYDLGYQWTIYDILFMAITALEGVLGAYVFIALQ